MRIGAHAQFHLPITAHDEGGQWRTHTVPHTSADTPDILDGRKLVALARALDTLVRSL